MKAGSGRGKDNVLGLQERTQLLGLQEVCGDRLVNENCNANSAVYAIDGVAKLCTVLYLAQERASPADLARRADSHGLNLRVCEHCIEQVVDDHDEAFPRRLSA